MGPPRTLMKKEELLQLWYQALAAEKGVVVETNDREKLKQKLYAARKEAKDPALNALSIRTSPDDPNQLWIDKRA